jgi:CheY-like chemotaxis protein
MLPRLLLVEDCELSRLIVMGMLEDLGCEVAFAVDGREGVIRAVSEDFHLVLMDCHLPVMDGFVAAQEIRRIKSTSGAQSHFPIVALTANSMDEDVQRCIDSGMDACLQKPAELEDLCAVLLKLLPQHFAAPVNTQKGQDLRRS